MEQPFSHAKIHMLTVPLFGRLLGNMYCIPGGGHGAVPHPPVCLCHSPQKGDTNDLSARWLDRDSSTAGFSCLPAVSAQIGSSMVGQQMCP